MGLNTLISNIFKTTSRDFGLRWEVGSKTSNLFGKSDELFLQKGYEENLDVYSIVKLLSDVCSDVPWIVERKGSEGWEKVEDTELNALMNAPNVAKGYTWSDINFQSVLYLLTTGNAFQLGIKPIGFNTISAIDVMPSQWTTIHSNKDWLDPIINYKLQVDRQKFSFEMDEVNHVKYFNPMYTTVDEALRGLSPIQVAARAVQVGNDRWDADANLLQNRGTIGILTDKSERSMTPTETENLQKKYDDKNAGTKNFGRVRVTNKDLNYIQMAMSSSDLQLLEKGVITTRALCNVYGCPSELFNDPDNKTFNTHKEAKKSLYTDSVMPILKRFEENYNRWLVPATLGDSKMWRMRADYSHVEALQEDLHEKAKTFSMLKTSGIITANDAAKSLGLAESIDTNADKLIVSSTNVLLETLND